MTASKQARSFRPGPNTLTYVMVLVDVAVAAALVDTLVSVARAGRPPGVLEVFLLLQIVLTLPLLVAATSVGFTRYRLDERGLTRKPLLGGAATIAFDSIDSIELRRSMGIELRGRCGARPLSWKWGLIGDGEPHDMIALAIQLSNTDARAVMDERLLRLLAAIEEVRGYSDEQVSTLTPRPVARGVRALREGRFSDLHLWLGDAKGVSAPEPTLSALAVMRELGTVP